MKRLLLLLFLLSTNPAIGAPLETQVAPPLPPMLTPTPRPIRGPIPSPWNRETFEKVMALSGRPCRLTDAEFKAIQDRKKIAVAKLGGYLENRFGAAEGDLLKAFAELPREYFQWNYEDKTSFAGTCYEWPAQPWAVGYGSALSDYQGQAYMIHLAQPEPNDVALEIGTGSGYNIALLSRLVRKTYSIEILKPLGAGVSQIFKPLGLTNVQTWVGDGYNGWNTIKGGFDIIIVTCAAKFVPPALLEQLKPHGRMVIPIGQPMRGKQVLYVYTKDSQGKVRSRKDMGVFFIPMTGQMEKAAAKDPTPVGQKAPSR